MRRFVTILCLAVMVCLLELAQAAYGTTPAGNDTVPNPCRCARRRLKADEITAEKDKSWWSFPLTAGISLLAGVVAAAAVLFSVLVAHLHAMTAWEKHDAITVKTGTDSIMMQIKQGFKPGPAQGPGQDTLVVAPPKAKPPAVDAAVKP